MFQVQKCLLSNFLRKQPRPPSFRYQFIYPIYIYLPESLALPRIVIHYVPTTISMKIHRG